MGAWSPSPTVRVYFTLYCTKKHTPKYKKRAGKVGNMKGIEYLKNKLSVKSGRVLTRYKYYEMKNAQPNLGKLIDQEMADKYKSTLGWCAKAVDSMADRLCLSGFDDDTFDVQSIFNMNNPDVLFDSAILSALISSCCFIYIFTGDDGTVKLQVIDGENATGIIDPTTGLLSEGYAVLERDADSNNVLKDAYFAPGVTTVYDHKNRLKTDYTNKVAYPLLVPIIYRPDAKRPFGHSRISRACMSLQNKAGITLTRSDITSQFYSFPQRYALGLSDDTEFDSKKASMSSFISFGKDEDGSIPSVGQFTQQNMEPHIEQFKMYTAAFAGETGLTMDDLGFATENPASSEAIKAGHETLRLTARKAQRTFGSGFINVGFIAACLRDNYPFQRRQFYNTKAHWMPIFEPDAAQMSGIGDAAIKINQAVPGYFDKDNLERLTGLTGGDNVGTVGDINSGTENVHK